MYLAARFLGIRADEWNRLPWWEQKLYSEGLSAERPDVARSVMMQKAQEPLKTCFANESTAQEDAEVYDFLSSHGFRVQHHHTSN